MFFIIMRKESERCFNVKFVLAERRLRMWMVAGEWQH